MPSSPSAREAKQHAASPASPFATVWNRLDHVVGVLSKVLSWIAAAAVLLMAVTVLIDVTGRNLFNSPLAGGLEVVGHWWMVAVVWLGLAEAQRLKEHMRATLIVDAMPPRIASGMSCLAWLCGAVIAGLMVGPTLQSAMQSLEVREAMVSSVSVPIWASTFLVPLGLALFALQSLVDAVSSGRQALTNTLEASHV